MNKENIESIYPLSPMQEGMLFHSIDGTESKVYVVVLHFSLHGALDVRAFKRAWQQVLDRHAVLRTFFVWKNRETPLQVVRKRVELPWQEQDWRHVPASERDERLNAFLQSDREQGFNLSSAPLMRLTLVQTTQNDYRFFLSHHHMLLDGWSVALLLKEVFAIYQTIRSGASVALEEVKPYREYIAWLRQQDLSEAEVFWRKRLQGFTDPTPLHIDEALEHAQSSMGVYDEQRLQLSRTTTAALRSLAQQHQLTLNTLIQGVWALLLSRYSGKTEVVFGAVVSGRSIALPGIEAMVGLFINAQPVRVQIPPQASLLPWLKELQGQQVQAREYEHCSLRNIQAWSDLVRSQGQSLFDSILVFGNYPLNDLLAGVAGDLEIGNVNFLEGSNYPITTLIDPGEALTIRMSYDAGRFSDTTIAQILKHVQTLLAAFTRNPHQSLAAFSPLTMEERQKLLIDFNQTEASYPADKTFIQLFEAQVTKTPNVVAVQFGQENLTYAQLNRHANQLAHYLRKREIGPDVLVGICVERSMEMMIGLLGILKAGGAYVPLDPSYPQERLNLMLEDSQAPVLLTHSYLRDRFLEYDGQVVCLDGDQSIIAQEEETDLVSGVTVENLAYVIFTSGSTGRPKGVQIPHQALTNFLSSMRYQPGLTEQDTFLAVTTISFDIAALELYLPLIVGACVIVVSREVASDGQMLLKTLANSKATIMQATPATWRLLIEAGWTGSPELKILCGGEALPPDLASRLMRRGLTLWNLYGPTETTIWSSAKRIESDREKVSIGRPIANTQTYILDHNLQPVPLGVPGELHIGGDGLARGYLNRPQLTADRFINNPFLKDAGEKMAVSARLYKTGDLARYLPDGNILYLGRLDHQVKIRGYRIELGEIEAILSQHPNVRQVVVVAHAYGPGDNRLVAYIVLKEGTPPTIGEWRDFLGQTLPNYMIPAAFIVLNEFPLTYNGKVNRKALPVPELDRSTLGSHFVAPRNVTEENLAKIWATVLKLEKVGVNDNFFDLGGDSIMTIQVMIQISRSFQIVLPPVALFESPTVAELADRVEKSLFAEIETMSDEEAELLLASLA